MHIIQSRLTWKETNDFEVGGIIYNAIDKVLVSSMGDIKVNGKILKQTRDRKYLVVMLYGECNGKIVRKKIRTNRLVAWTYFGRPTNIDDEAHHKNGHRTDNRPSNLCWLTQKEHKELTKQLKQHNKGSSVGISILDEEILPSIVNYLLEGKSDKQICKKISEFGYDIGPWTIAHIRNGRTWTEYTKDLDIPKSLGSKGQNNGQAKLTSDTVKYIRKLNDSGLDINQILSILKNDNIDISRTTVSQICKYETWRNL